MRLPSTSRTASAMLAVTLMLPFAAVAQTAPANTPPKASPQAAPGGGSVDSATPGSMPATTTAPATMTPHATMRHGKVAAKSHYAPIDRVDQRITQLHRQLKITTAEDPQWQEFTAVMRMNATAANQAYTDRSKQLGTMTAVDDMKSYSDLTMMHAENMQKLTTAFEKLYAALSPDQQKTADTLFRGAAARHKG